MQRCCREAPVLFLPKLHSKALCTRASASQHRAPHVHGCRSTIYQLVDQLSARKPSCNRGEFDTLQKNVGFNHCPQGALMSQPLRQHLRPITAGCFDWMHCYLVAGLFHGETNLLLDVLAKEGLKPERIHQAFQEFTWPPGHPS